MSETMMNYKGRTVTLTEYQALKNVERREMFRTVRIGRGKESHVAEAGNLGVHCGRALSSRQSVTEVTGPATCKTCKAYIDGRLNRDHAEALKMNAPLPQHIQSRESGKVWTFAYSHASHKFHAYADADGHMIHISAADLDTDFVDVTELENRLREELAKAETVVAPAETNPPRDTCDALMMHYATLAHDYQERAMNGPTLTAAEHAEYFREVRGTWRDIAAIAARDITSPRWVSVPLGAFLAYLDETLEFWQARADRTATAEQEAQSIIPQTDTPPVHTAAENAAILALRDEEHFALFGEGDDSAPLLCLYQWQGRGGEVHVCTLPAGHMPADEHASGGRLQ